MFDFDRLSRKYHHDAPFNKAVNLFRQLIELYGFMPSELREALFLAQYQYEMGHVERQVRTEEEWRQFHELKLRMNQMIVTNFKDLEKYISSQTEAKEQK